MPERFADLADERGADGPPVSLWGAWLRAETEDETTGAATDGAHLLSDGSEAEARAIDELRRVLLDPKEQEQKVLIHSFEKVETLDSWEGTVQNEDGSDELDKHLEALEEVDLRELVRGGEQARSLLKADIDVAADIPDVEQIAASEQGVTYPEWDYRAGRYREEWCTVYPTPFRASHPGGAARALLPYRALTAKLRARLEAHRSRLEPLDRQLDGDHPDIDALVDHLACVRAGQTGDGRLYIRSQRSRRDFAATVLLDVSLSSDSWIDNRRVLDVARDAVLVLGEVAHQLSDRLQVLAFASSTRNRCRVFEVKGWDHPWTSARDRLCALQPQGYTRIGPALRHATRELASVRADARLLLLISDGKPNDYDRYEGRYGIADVRMALREAAAMGIATHALAIDTKASAWLPSMLGVGRWHVLSTPDALVPALTEVYGRWVGR